MGHSVNGIDEVVSTLFRPGYIGTACEVGANNGIAGSNTLLFERRGWSVLCIEANPACAEMGRSARRMWQSVAVGAEDCDESDFSIFSEGSEIPGNSALGTESRYCLAEPPQAKRTIKVPVRRLDRLLSEHGFSHLDYLSVDVEGWEPDVLAGFTTDRWRPRVIVLEDWKDEYVVPGYDKFRRCEYDNIYIRKSDV